MENDVFFMSAALEEAEAALFHDDVPVGAVIVLNGEVIGKAHNKIELLKDATAHAEMLAIREAVKNTGSKWLQGAEVYVTLEPCVMCAGALVMVRVSKIIYGAGDEKFGGCGSIFDIADDFRLNHRIKVIHGIMKEKSAALLKRFFSGKR